MAGSPPSGSPRAAETVQNAPAFPGELRSVASGRDRGSPAPRCHAPGFRRSPEGDGPVPPRCAGQGQPEQPAPGLFALFPSAQVTFPGFRLVQTCPEAERSWPDDFCQLWHSRRCWPRARLRTPASSVPSEASQHRFGASWLST